MEKVRSLFGLRVILNACLTIQVGKPYILYSSLKVPQNIVDPYAKRVPVAAAPGE